MSQHGFVEVSEPRSRLDTQLLNEQGAGVPVGLQRVGLAPGPVEREHQLAVQALAQRLLSNQMLQLGYQLRVATRGQVGVDAQLERR